MEGYYAAPSGTGAGASARDGDGPEASSSGAMSGATKVPDMNARRKMYPKEQWAVLKPIIQKLYVEEGQTFTKVAQYLHEHHGFSPTKKQFTRRISEWGFEKNIKREERRAILESLGPEVNVAEFEPKKLRGRRLDKAKIDRWRKMEGVGSSETQTGTAQSPGNQDGTSNQSDRSYSPTSELGPLSFTSPEDVPAFSQQLASMSPYQDLSPYQDSTFNDQSLVAVGQTPGLNELIAALTIDHPQGLQPLDISASSEEDEDAHDLLTFTEASSSSLVHTPNKQHSQLETAQSLLFSGVTFPTFLSNQTSPWTPGPSNEIYPFPNDEKPVKIFRIPRTTHLVSSHALKTKELECRKRFKHLKGMGRDEIDELAEDMQSVAWRHYELNQYRLAEIWMRRVITALLEIRQYRPFEVLHACLQVVNMIRNQCKYNEALDLHQGVHNKIMSLVGSEHELAILSMERSALSWGDLGQRDLEIAVYRELLQILLLRFGTRNRQTLKILLCLGFALVQCGRFDEAETILRIRLQFDREVSADPARQLSDDQNSLMNMSELAWSQYEQGKYQECKCVLNAAKIWHKDLIDISSEYCWGYFNTKACILKVEGRLAECEKVLRDILGQEWLLPPDAAPVMERLAEVMMETGRQPEAVKLWEEIFNIQLDIFRVKHDFPISYLEKLGLCCAVQGLYDDAIGHLHRAIGLITEGKELDLELRRKYTEAIRDLIFKVENMREGAHTLLSPQSLQGVGFQFGDFPG